MRALPLLLLLAGPDAPARSHQAQGLLAGEPTPASVLLQTRLTATPGPELDADGDVPGAAGVVRFEWDEDPAFPAPGRSAWLEARAERDFIVRAEVSGLKPGTRYHARAVAGPAPESAQPGAAGAFRTLPGPGSDAPVSFCMGSCMHYHAFMSGKANGGGPVTATDEDKRLGYPAFAAMERLRPDFFVGAGDIVYYDHPHSAPARTPAELRRKWHEQFRLPRLVSFLGRTPAYWSKDDHDFRFNDADLRDGAAPDARTGIDLFHEQMPLRPAGNRDAPSHRTHRVGRHLQLWFTEGRDHRSPNDQPDGPDKTLWGAAQRAWLQETLAASDATWKLIISPTPMIGPDRAGKRDNHTNPKGFAHEAGSFFRWAEEKRIGRLLVLCGDRHWQYHSIHPSGVEEFGCGALNDENSIRGVKPGAPGSTDPGGRLRQPYLYAEPTGGFLHVACSPAAEDPARLTLTFHDDRGAVLHRVEKSGRP